jgi:hypothetical protein
MWQGVRQGEQPTLLTPMKRNPRLGMTRKIWISSALALATAMLVLAPTTAFAGSPLLSGYGGPGAGEQAILGSTLVGGSAGGGAGGSSGSGSGSVSLSGSAGVSTSSAGGVSSTGSGSARGSGVGAANVGSGSGETTSKGGTSRGGRSTGVGGAASAYVNSTSQGSLASASPLTGISSGDLLLLVGILATLGLVAVLTLRLSRLQS